MFLGLCCDVRYDFHLKTMLDSCVLTPICFVGGSRFNYVNCIYCLLKNTSTKDNKYVVNQKLEHVDDISFGEPFGKIRVFFFQNKSVPS